MQQFEVENIDGAMDLQTTERTAGHMVFPVRAEARYSSPTNPWPRDPEAEARDMAGVQKRKPTYKRQGPSNRWDQYGESSSATSSEAHNASEQVSLEPNWGPWPPTEPGNKDGEDRLSHIDFRRPTKVMANGPSGLAMSDSRSLTNGTVVPPDGTRLPAASAPGNMYHQNGMDQSGLHRLEGLWVGPEYDTDKNGRCEA